MGRTNDWSKLVVGLAILLFVVGYLVRPDSVTNGRVGYLIMFDIQGCHSFDTWLTLDFPSKVYAALAYALPLDLTTLGAWDILIAFVGGAILLVLLSFFTSKENYTLIEAGLVLAAVALCGVYIFMLNKDFLQFLVFLGAFFIIASRLSVRGKLISCAVLFALEFFWWRQYYLIVAVFLVGLYFALGHACSKARNTRARVTMFVVVAILGMLAFSTVLYLASPENYAAIVGKHGVDREEYTVMMAASGIASLIDVTSSSPPYLFVANWVVNTTRLLFPVELFLKGPYYAVFAVYQLGISFFAVRALLHVKRCDRESHLVLALYFAFVLASATFEPDFGSWVRHETACLPVMLLVVSIGRRGTLSGLTGQEKKEGKRSPYGSSVGFSNRSSS
ncbi:hypothetical protein [Gordonibacter massiliensis (ex Traore et al. 2017)]|uniref:hypothetical protein n=1 Tax=Gordonibacter massiliensis (ex Traore et al. 2017) TaxID=1841863 RepID=UPI001C8BE030|nr:hypothetical protein [Gordonibacter massiliensis (ex Traore et al. 2017)]MBX9033739.1 hypothetical protein [Gordonibacter massiliensis (ex Traore et al. 2017)]